MTNNTPCISVVTSPNDNQYVSWSVSLLVFFLSITTVNAQAVGIHGELNLANGVQWAIHQADVQFQVGTVYSSTAQAGQLHFMGPAQARLASDDSYSAVSVSTQGQADFLFPLGDSGLFQPLAITEGSGQVLAAQFHFTAPPQGNLPAGIVQLSPNFYWSVNGSEIATLQLSWNRFAQLDNWAEDLSTLRILGYTGSDWELIPAQLAPFSLIDQAPTSLTEGALHSTEQVNFAAYTALSIGAVTFNTSLNISQAITPNGDGINDVWFIENIERYPQARIYVYNRWGAQVFHQPGNYRNNWGGTFDNNTQPLPSAPYFYRIDTDNDGEIDREGWLYINH